MYPNIPIHILLIGSVGTSKFLTLKLIIQSLL
jgi:hypothetical protein